ncbi:MAG: hemin uptake protein HemP [Rhodocyclaceae bacterium]|nr:hemin uptake protein HemP [Rhodocyclaceae bacterium]
MDSTPTDSPLPPVITLTPGENGQPPLLDTEQLFRDQNTLRIAHEGNFYLLRVTRENKLILTK